MVVAEVEDFMGVEEDSMAAEAGIMVAAGIMAADGMEGFILVWAGMVMGIHIMDTVMVFTLIPMPILFMYP